MLLSGLHLVLAFACVGALALLLGTRSRWNRALVCAAMAVLGLVYADWRIGQWQGLARLPSPDSWIVGAFLVIEVVCIFDFLTFLLLMSRSTDRRAASDDFEREWRAKPIGALPEVDVFISTYNEDPSILEKTIVGCMALDYPKKNVWVCDDGRRGWLETYCARHGVGYITRADNRNAKAGNNNNALRATKAPFVATFDADFIPFPNFLWRTLGFFADPRVGIVQTPQAFYNTDPLQKNLLRQRALPSELRMFYETMQPARDAWNCAFYVGSCAVLRRSAIEAIGGIVEGCDTEDQVTTVALLRKGFVTRYLDERLSVGLAPETLAAMVEQRKRWARGALQILFRSDGPFGWSMTLVQRILFLQTFWWVGQLAPIVFAAAPISLWMFKIRLFPFTDPFEVMIMPALYYIATAVGLIWLSRGLWWPIMTPASQLVAALRTAPTTLTSLIKPFGKPLLRTAAVTPKGAGAPLTGTDWRTLVPLLVLLGGTVLGLVDSVVLGDSPARHPYEAVAAIGWTALILTHLTLGALACVERPYRRSEERFSVAQAASIVGGAGSAVDVIIADLSLSGARVRAAAPFDTASGARISLAVPELGLLPCEVIRSSDGGRTLALRLIEVEPELRNSLIRYLFLNPAQTQEPDRFPVHRLIGNLWDRFLRVGP